MTGRSWSQRPLLNHAFLATIRHVWRLLKCAARAISLQQASETRKQYNNDRTCTKKEHKTLFSCFWSNRGRIKFMVAEQGFDSQQDEEHHCLGQSISKHRISSCTNWDKYNSMKNFILSNSQCWNRIPKFFIWKNLIVTEGEKNRSRRWEKWLISTSQKLFSKKGKSFSEKEQLFGSR